MDNNFDQFKSLIKDLEGLKSLKASKQLKNRINHILLPTLPGNKKYFPPHLFALRPLALAILILILMGTGAVVASQNTKPGDFLYPVKIVVNGLINKNTPTPSPTPTISKNNANGDCPLTGDCPRVNDETIESPERILEINGSPNPVKPTIVPDKKDLLPDVSIPLITPTPIIEVQNPIPTPTTIEGTVPEWGLSPK